MKRVCICIIILLSMCAYAQEPDSTATKKMVEYELYQESERRIEDIEQALIAEYLRTEKITLPKAFVNLYIQNQAILRENQRIATITQNLISDLIAIDNKEVKAVLKKYGIK